jgi:hypothetical protein
MPTNLQKMKEIAVLRKVAVVNFESIATDSQICSGGISLKSRLPKA